MVNSSKASAKQALLFFFTHHPVDHFMGGQ
jgi:hypothetical protein